MPVAVSIQVEKGVIYIDGVPVWALPGVTGTCPRTGVGLDDLNQRVSAAAMTCFDHDSSAMTTPDPDVILAVIISDAEDDTLLVINGISPSGTLGSLKERLLVANA